jgi:hypothetical protein
MVFDGLQWFSIRAGSCSYQLSKPFLSLDVHVLILVPKNAKKFFSAKFLCSVAKCENGVPMEKEFRTRCSDCYDRNIEK